MKLALVLTIALVATAAACTACNGSKEDQLVEARLEQRRALDRLYTEYGGGQLASELQKETARGAAEADADKGKEGAAAAKELMKVMGNAVGELDRAAFETQCETLGSGQRPLIMNEKAKVFFSSSRTEKDCIEIAKRERKIDALEKELGLAP